MIAILCDFRQSWAKELALFSKTNVMIAIFGDFRQLLAKRIGAFLKNQYCDQFCFKN
jgi:hypothetical protein